MSALFGPVIQQGYVVSDIDEAIRHWVARGVGPFFIEQHIRPAGQYDGRAIKPDLSAAFAYSGEQQIEVIQQHDDEPTIYLDYLAAHPDGGLQHLAVWVDDIADVLADLESRGLGYTVRQRYGDGHAYLDADDAPGVMMQLMARSDHLVSLMETIRAASIGSRPPAPATWCSRNVRPKRTGGC